MMAKNRYLHPSRFPKRDGGCPTGFWESGSPYIMGKRKSKVAISVFRRYNKKQLCKGEDEEEYLHRRAKRG